MNQRQIADYLLIRELGRGSMGDTFLAEHRFLKRPFIVKVLPAELSSDAELMQRFETEVQSLSRLEHPHIARIHNASCAEGVHFLVTEPVIDARGQVTNLGEYFLNRQYELPEEEILRIATQLASAVDFAHDVIPEPVAHGSIKLNNIVIRETEEGPLAFLTDFGLSGSSAPSQL